ncbi:MAG: NAD(P)-dependent oxidoreductase [Acidimicrobiia bacterium]|nr:NAD(P)-dependent oxidoreductase [Acidimicrobiia bacterium]
MRAAVFGGAGFLGSWVADALSEAGHRVVVFDRQASPYLRAGQEAVVGDILDADAVRAAVRGCDVVYNYAGVSDIEEAARQPVETVRANVLGNTILLDAAREAGVKRFVFASTLYVYSASGAFYRSSKQASELIIEDYQKAFGLPYTILRYGSLYGPRAGDTNWIWRMLNDAVASGAVRRLGDGEEIREYVHVWDAAGSSVDILAPEFANTHVIISGQQAVRVRDLLAMVNGILGGRLAVEYVPVERLGDGGGAHYGATPYAFNPRIAKKIARSSYVDLGQGLLDLVERIHRAQHAPERHEDLLVDE